MLDPIHTNTTCVVKPGLTELKSETENWKTEFFTTRSFVFINGVDNINWPS